MAYTFNVVAWEGWNGRRYGGVPRTPQQAKGLKVMVTNPDNPGDTHQFWAFNRSPKSAYQDFAEWWTYIGGLMVMHGMELSDEPPDDDFDEPGGGYDDEPDEDYDEDEDEDEPEEKPTVLQRVGRWFRSLFK